MKGRKLLSLEQVEQIEALLADGVSQKAIGTMLGIESSTVGTVAHGRHYHQQSSEEQSRRRTEGAMRAYVPSQREIRAACAKFLRQRPRNPVGYRPSGFRVVAPSLEGLL